MFSVPSQFYVITLCSMVVAKPSILPNFCESSVKKPAHLSDIFDSYVEKEECRMWLCPCDGDGSHVSCYNAADNDTAPFTHRCCYNNTATDTNQTLC